MDEDMQIFAWVAEALFTVRCEECGECMMQCTCEQEEYDGPERPDEDVW